MKHEITHLCLYTLSVCLPDCFHLISIINKAIYKPFINNQDNGLIYLTVTKSNVGSNSLYNHKHSFNALTFLISYRLTFSSIEVFFVWQGCLPSTKKAKTLHLFLNGVQE